MADRLSEDESVLVAQNHLAYYMGLVHTTDMVEAFGGAAVPYAHHLEMIDVLTQDALGHSAIVEPRGAAKTMLVQALVEWLIGRASLSGDKDWAKRMRFLLLSHSAHKAYSVSLAIMNTIQGPVYQRIFPRVKASEVKWSQEEWRVKGNEGEPHPTFIAAGIDSPPLGGRFDYILLDDIADEKNMATGLQREKIRGTLSDTINPMLVPERGRYIMTSTRWAHDDPVWWALSRGFHVLERKALTKDEEGRWVSYWPERFPVQWLLEEWERYRASGNEKSFLRQYQNEVVPDEGLVFQRAWFDQRYEALPERPLFVVDSWDTASGIGRKRSSTAGLSALVTPDYHIYLFCWEKAQIVYGAQRDAIRALHQRSRSHYIVIESKSTGQALLHDQMMSGLPLVPWAPSGERGAKATKEQSAQWVTEYCSRGWLHLPSDYAARRLGLELFGLEQDLWGYDGKESPGADTVDALAQLVLFVQERRAHGEAMMAASRPDLRYGQTQGVRRAV